MTKLHYKILAQRDKIRVGQITLNGVTMTTPCFMPVGTKATIKGIMLDLLKQPQYIGQDNPISLILANTFHLYLRPGEAIVHKAGGLHRFENRDKLILTDSGGFQIFSLGLSKLGKGLFTLMPDGVSFQSPIDGSRHIFTPSKVIDIQSMLGSDIMMVLDVCSPVTSTSKDEIVKQLRLTHDWADMSFHHFLPQYDTTRGCLFPIVQGGTHTDLREESVQYLSQYAIDGIAIGGLSVGESKQDMYQILDFLSDKLPTGVPRYLMGVGTVEDLQYAIGQGIDLFDCVHPTRLGRHGVAMTRDGNIKLKNSQYANDYSCLTDDCRCHTCLHYTKAYLHHLINVGEMLGGILLSLHNIAYLHKVVEDIKMDILQS